jgi:hypothetical protein
MAVTRVNDLEIYYEDRGDGLPILLVPSYLRLVRHDPEAAVEVTYRWVMSSTRGGSS